LGSSPVAAIAAFGFLLWLASLNSAVELAATLIAAPLLIRASLALREARWALWFGALSYPLYATHVPVIRVAASLSVPAPIALMTALAFAALFVATVERKRVVRHNVRRAAPVGVAI
jgi:peptidoglycan/LPS O-acetylase OafA/YrhL